MQRRNKYLNKKIRINKEGGKEVVFDSKGEYKRYCLLELFEKQGIIQNLKRQVEFVLQKSFKRNGKTHRAITYIADATYTQNGFNIIEDFKSKFTKKNDAKYPIKKKTLLFILNKEEIESETKNEKKPKTIFREVFDDGTMEDW